jgi:hypothetical protein
MKAIERLAVRGSFEGSCDMNYDLIPICAASIARVPPLCPCADRGAMGRHRMSGNHTRAGRAQQPDISGLGKSFIGVVKSGKALATVG